MHKKPFLAILDTFIFFPYDPPSLDNHPLSLIVKIFGILFKGEKMKSLRMSQKSFLDNKNNNRFSICWSC